MFNLSSLLPMLGLDPEKLPKENDIKGVFEQLQQIPERLDRIEQALVKLTQE